MVVINQYLDAVGNRCEDFIAMKTFHSEDSITGERLFDAMVKEIFNEKLLKKVFSIV